MSVILVYDAELWAPPRGLRIEGQAISSSASAEELGHMLAGHDVMVAGDDRLLGRLVAGVSLTHPASLTRYAPLRVGEFSEVGSSTDVAQMLAVLKAGGAKESVLSTLRVVSSGQARATVGFQFGAGAVARITEMWTRHGMSSGTARFIVNEARNGEEDRVEFRLNHGEPQRAAYLQFCAIKNGWLKMTADDRPTVRFGASPSDLLKGLPSRRLTSLSRRVTGRADGFEVVHITAHNGYVIDGEVSGNMSDVVQISSGPRVRILKV